jgi:hypothetical protein
MVSSVMNQHGPLSWHLRKRIFLDLRRTIPDEKSDDQVLTNSANRWGQVRLDISCDFGENAKPPIWCRRNMPYSLSLPQQFHGMGFYCRKYWTESKYWFKDFLPICTNHSTNSDSHLLYIVMSNYFRICFMRDFTQNKSLRIKYVFYGITHFICNKSHFMLKVTFYVKGGLFPEQVSFYVKTIFT